MNGFINAMGTSGLTYTENGALTHADSGNPLVDFFFHGAALRNETNTYRIMDLFNNSFNEYPEETLRILFYIRDVRGGQGERQVFRTILLNKILESEHFAKWFCNHLFLIPDYGRWDDLIYIYTECFKRIALIPQTIATTFFSNGYNFIRNTLETDYELAQKNLPCSLLAKWLPSENTSSKDTVARARMMINYIMDGNAKEYRKKLSLIRKHLRIVEQDISAKTYENINYEQVPAKASLKYRNAFRRHDKERYSEYLSNVAQNKAKIQTKTLYPYELVQKAIDFNDYIHITNIDENEIHALNLMWKNLPDYVDDVNGLVVADTSGSMIGLPMSVSISLAIYIAERNKNKAFKDYFISFSYKPKFHKITGDTLMERVKSVQLGDIANTNVYEVFTLILNRAVEYNVPNEDMPKTLLIISDMEFDAACDNHSQTNFEAIKRLYRNAKYDMPTLVFWNVASRNNQCPVSTNEKGVILLSGCNPVIMKYAMNNCRNPMDIINGIISDDRYSRITIN